MWYTVGSNLLRLGPPIFISSRKAGFFRFIALYRETQLDLQKGVVVIQVSVSLRLMTLIRFLILSKALAMMLRM